MAGAKIAKLVKLLSWDAEIAAKKTLLTHKGVEVDATPLVRTSAVIGEMARLNPAVLVLDLDRLPSNSREIALMLRASKSACHIPILLVGSLAAADDGRLPDKYARLRGELPDLPYAIWAKSKAAMTKLLKEPISAPFVVPPERVYTTSLAQKLGVVGLGRASTAQKQVALVAAPDGFVELLGDLPETVKLTEGLSGKTDLAVCFILSLEELASMLDMLTLRLPKRASAWIAYPKRATDKHLNFNENDVRGAGLAAGLVDYKVCSIDATWSGLKFAWRKRA